MKGQYIGMLTVFVLVFIITGNVFGALLFQEEYKEEIKFSIGNYNTIAEAQVIGERYIPRMETETNYSSNIIALRINDEENHQKWNEFSVASKQQLKTNYEQRVKEELGSQSKIFGCSDPEVTELNVEDKTNYIAKLEPNSITCRESVSEEGSSTIADIKLEKDEVSVDNEDNRYVRISEEAVELGDSLSNADYPEWQGSGSASSGTEDESCVSSVSLSQLKQNAESEAIDKAEESKDDIIAGDDDFAEHMLDKVEDAEDSYQKPDWINIETNSDVEYRTIIQYANRDSCSLPDDEGDEQSGQRGSAGAKAVPDDLILNYTLEDSERRVIDLDGGRKSIPFKFEFVKDMD
ncbi:MAG: hypothetical protein BRC28_01630 [Nanohaloarchaea archaeon SW_4_43_9]|nr:MAG: hypothetical protein BRC28_01630 [Nanohaloarchaea archaeon SW_4_43_9]